MNTGDWGVKKMALKILKPEMDLCFVLFTQLALEKEESEHEKWEILKRARDAAERSMTLKSEVDIKEKLISKLESELIGVGTLRGAFYSFNLEAKLSKPRLNLLIMFAPIHVLPHPFSSHTVARHTQGQQSAQADHLQECVAGLCTQTAQHGGDGHHSWQLPGRGFHTTQAF